MAAGKGVGYTLKIEGLEELQKKFEQAPEEIEKEMGLAMKKSVLLLEVNIKPHTPVYRGMLRNSISGEVKKHEATVIGIVGSALKGEVYPAVMEYGRRAGRRPPPYRKLIPWVRRVLKVSKKYEASVAFLVARSIGRKGIKGRRYMEKGLKESTRRINGFFEKALERIVKKL